MQADKCKNGIAEQLLCPEDVLSGMKWRQRSVLRSRAYNTQYQHV